MSTSQISLNTSVANFNSARQSDTQNMPTSDLSSKITYQSQTSSKFISSDKFIQDKFKQSIFKKPHLTGKTTPGQAPYQLPGKYVKAYESSKKRKEAFVD